MWYSLCFVSEGLSCVKLNNLMYMFLFSLFDPDYINVFE